MRIVLLNDKYGQPGASSRIVRSLKEAYGKHGHEVAVITTHRVEEDPTIRRDDEIASLPVSYRLSLRHWKSLRMPAVSRMLESELARLRPDVVHAHNLHTYLTYDALRVARGFTDKVFLTAHDVMSIAYGRLATRRFLDSGGEDCRLTALDHIRTAGLQWNPWRNAVIRRTIGRNVRAVAAVSDALRRALEQNGIPRCVTVRNAMELPAPAPAPGAAEAFRKAHGLEGKKVILFGGRIGADKGAPQLLAAFARVRAEIPEARILVAGDRRRWEGFVAEHAVGADLLAGCVVAGWLDPEALRAAYAACDLVTTPSMCLDTFNLMNLEAMAAGKPVVGTRFGGTPEVVEDGVTGFIVDPRDTTAYADRMTKTLGDPAFAARMGEAGRRRAEAEFTLDRQAEEYLSLYAGNGENGGHE